MERLWLERPHRRWNPLKGEWVLVSPQRTQRPWQGQTEDKPLSTMPAYDPDCYLCPGNSRAGGELTPKYDGTYVFTNDFPALLPDGKQGSLHLDGTGLVRAETEHGICRVLCFHPRHNLTLATMTREQVLAVVEMWSSQVKDLSAKPEISYVQIFENRGAMMGASNPHPHGQIWATEHLPNEPSQELNAQRVYFLKHKIPLLTNYLNYELSKGERVVVGNETWAAVVPFWAVWPFETLVLPRRPVGTFADLSPTESAGLAEVLHTLTAGYNCLFATPFPYSMGFHIAPSDGQTYPEWVMHAHFFPPLLRSATIRKFMVGFELLGSPQRDITPERAAEALRLAIVSNP